MTVSLYTRRGRSLPEGLKLEPFTSSLDVPIEVYWDLLEGIIGHLKNDIIKPNKATYEFACDFCRALYHPECVKRYSQPWKARCVREALRRETREALGDAAEAYNLGQAMIEQFELILEEKDRRHRFKNHKCKKEEEK